MGSEYYENCRKGWIWTLVINFKKQLAIFYLDTYRRLTSYIIKFLKIISQKKIPKFFWFQIVEVKIEKIEKLV
jgi:hypothetical protein